MTSTHSGLAGRTAVVTGGAQGIGAAVVDRLVAESVRVLIIDKSPEHGRTLYDRHGSSAVAVVVADVCDEAAVAAAICQLPTGWPRASLLVNLAAGFVFKGLEASREEWLGALDPTIIGLANVVKHFVRQLPDDAVGASIVTMASISAHIAQEGYLTYNTGKSAILGFTRCLAQELAPRGVRVNSVSPGTVWNANNAKFHTEVLGLDRAAAESSSEYGAKFLLRRFADPEEVAGPIAFLLSKDASFITGSDLVIDGGYMAV